MSDGKAGGNLRGFYIVFAAVALIGIGALGFNLASRAMGSAAMQPVDLEGAREDMRLLRDLAVPVSVGDEDAPVTIIVFGDYLCNHCATFSLRHRPQVLRELVETGKARLEFYDFVLDTRPEVGTFLAARAARCAGDQGRFWDYHDHLYRNQITWGLDSDKLGMFQDFADELGLDRGEFRGCLNSDRFAQEVTANWELAQALRLGGTPAVLVGAEGGMPLNLPDFYFPTIQQAVVGILDGSGGN